MLNTGVNFSITIEAPIASQVSLLERGGSHLALELGCMKENRKSPIQNHPRAVVYDWL